MIGRSRIPRMLFVMLMLCHAAFADKTLWSKIDKGNELYEQGKWPEAMTQYSDAQLEAPTQPEIFFNMGNTLYRQGKFTEAVDSYRQSMEKADVRLEGKALYNMGNALFAQGQLKEALETYKQALERDPEDTDTKYNIEYTERKIKEMLSQAQKTAAKAMQEQALRDAQAQEGKEDEAGQAGREGGEDGEGRDNASEEQGAHDQENKTVSMGAQEAEADKDKNEDEEGARAAGEDDQAEKQGSREGQASGARGRDSKGNSRERNELTEEEAGRVLAMYEQNQEPLFRPDRQPARSGRQEFVAKDW